MLPTVYNIYQTNFYSYHIIRFSLVCFTTLSLCDAEIARVLSLLKITSLNVDRSLVQRQIKALHTAHNPGLQEHLIRCVRWVHFPYKLKRGSSLRLERFNQPCVYCHRVCTGEVRDDSSAPFEVMCLQPGKVQKPKISQIVLADL